MHCFFFRNREVFGVRDDIIATAGELIGTYGLKKFTMDEVARRLKMSKKTVYQIFDSKQELITAYFQHVYETDMEVTKAILADASKTLREQLHEVVASYENHYITMKVSEEAEQSFPIQWEQLEQIRKTKVDALNVLLEKASEQNLIRGPYKKELIVIIIDQWSQLIMRPKFLKQYGDLSTREIAIASVDIILNGCLAHESDD